MATERGFDRLVNFSDAVVAIAATLLVLPIVETAAYLNEHNVDSTIHQAVPAFFTFTLSFVVIGRFWFSHHKFFERLTGYSPRLVWFNLMWLLGIVVMPFPTALIATASTSDRLAVLVYLGTMLWISLAQLLMGAEVYLRSDLLVPGEHRATSMVISGVLSALLILSFVVGALWPSLGLWSLLLLLFVQPISKPMLRFTETRDGVAGTQ